MAYPCTRESVGPAEILLVCPRLVYQRDGLRIEWLVGQVPEYGRVVLEDLRSTDNVRARQRALQSDDPTENTRVSDISSMSTPAASKNNPIDARRVSIILDTCCVARDTTTSPC